MLEFISTTLKTQHHILVFGNPTFSSLYVRKTHFHPSPSKIPHFHLPTIENHLLVIKCEITQSLSLTLRKPNSTHYYSESLTFLSTICSKTHFHPLPSENQHSHLLTIENSALVHNSTKRLNLSLQRQKYNTTH